MDAEKKKSSKEVSVDDILKILGPFGKFNCFSYILILFPVFLSGMYSSVYNFEVMDLKYRCSVPECNLNPSMVNFTIPHDSDGVMSKCVRYAPVRNLNITNSSQCSPHYFDTSTEIACDSFVYLEEHSIVKEFNLACQDWKRTLVGTVHNAGFFVSIPLTGLISDKYGRLPALVFAMVANGAFGVVRALATGYEMFVAFEFLEPAFGAGVYTAAFVLALVFAMVANGAFGVVRALATGYEMFVAFEFLEPAFGAGVYTAAFVLGLELVGPKGRVFVSLLFNSMFIIGGVSVTLLAWWLKNWRYLLFIIYTPSVFGFLYIWTLTESFRWLFSKGRYEEGINVLLRAERMNKVTIPKDHYAQVEKTAMQQRDERKCLSKQQETSSFNQVLQSPMIWKRLCTCSFLWISSTLVYYGLSINAIELSGNSYLNYIVVIVIEAPANVCKLIFLDRFGRKKVIAVAYFMTALILINYGFVPAGNWSILLYLGGKFFITLAYNSLYVFAAEVFPTNYRTTLLAMCSTIGRIGSTFAPQTPLLARYYEYLPTMLFGIMASISGFLVLTLPETLNMKLPDTLQEAEDQDKKKVKPDDGESIKTRL